MSVSAAELSRRIAAHFAPHPPETLGVAVSGGSDSLALLALLQGWTGAEAPKLHVVTVDHGLRSEAAQEAADVAAFCAAAGLPHDILRWNGWDGSGNLPDQARRARYGLMAEWAKAKGIGDIALGHTQDDQAETFLMRLARGAGLDGLSGMSARRSMEGVVFHRPLLSVSREQLRAVLRAKGLGWADDPSNFNDAYERVRARQVLAALAPLGIEAQGLAEVAGHLGQARAALYHQARAATQNILRFDEGDMLFDCKALLDLPKEVARRLVQHGLVWISGAEYAPRGAAVTRLLEAIADRREMNLHGCRALHRGGMLRLTREAGAVGGLRCPADQVWDGRWRLSGPEAPDAEIAALGEAGLPLCPDRRETGRPGATLAASPAVWQGETLIAAPLAGLENGWSAHLTRDATQYHSVLLSH